MNAKKNVRNGTKKEQYEENDHGDNIMISQKDMLNGKVQKMCEMTGVNERGFEIKKAFE